jgi:hypothetical protein
MRLRALGAGQVRVVSELGRDGHARNRSPYASSATGFLNFPSPSSLTQVAFSLVKMKQVRKGPKG